MAVDQANATSSRDPAVGNDIRIGRARPAYGAWRVTAAQIENARMLLEADGFERDN